MALGSLPACAATLWLLGSWQAAGAGYEAVVMTTLGVALVLTAGVTLLRPLIAAFLLVLGLGFSLNELI